MNSHVDVVNHNDNRHVASATIYSALGSSYTNHNSEYYAQKPVSIMYASSFISTSNTQHTHVYPNSLATNLQHVIPPQNMLMNERIFYVNVNYPAI